MTFSRTEIQNEMNETLNPFRPYGQVVQDLQPGDLVEIKRIDIVTRINDGFNHWVIFHTVVNGKAMCYHISPYGASGTGWQNISPVSSGACWSVINYEPLNVICGNSPCRINNLTKKINEQGYDSQPDIDKVFKTLVNLKYKIVKYDDMTANCEMYCLYWKYGLPISTWSGEVEDKRDTCTLM